MVFGPDEEIPYPFTLYPQGDGTGGETTVDLLSRTFM